MKNENDANNFISSTTRDNTNTKPWDIIDTQIVGKIKKWWRLTDDEEEWGQPDDLRQRKV